jgi:tRNA nucleotidyltransferase (CCA-adding enzyme)
LAREYGGQVTSHSRFGTAKWDISAIKNALVAGFDGSSTQDTLPEDLPDSLDLISARTEFYERPTALPTVERSSIKLDLHRRDFTINTLAIRLDGKHLGSLHDYWGGLADLRRGVVRVMHSLSFIDDPTRLLRAVRFEQRFQFEIEARTRQLMDQARDLLSQVSGDRIRHELNLILIEPRVEQMLDRLEELHLLQAIHPDLPSRIPGNWQSPPPADWNLLNRTGGQSTQLQLAYALWFSGLTPQQARGITARLALSASLRTMILSAIHLAEEIPSIKGLPASQVSSRLDKLPVLSIYAIYQLVDDEALKNTLWMYATRWKWVMPLTTGDTLQALGIKPGPPFRVILENLRNAWLDGSIHSADEEQSLLEELLRQEQNQLMDDNHAPRKTGSSLA